MELFIKKKVGKEIYNFTVEGKNLYECVMESQKLSFGTIDKCGICNSDNLILNGRLAQKKFKYVEIKCLSCKAQLVFGSTQEDPNVYYLRKDKGTRQYDWQEYKPESKSEE